MFKKYINELKEGYCLANKYDKLAFWLLLPGLAIAAYLWGFIIFFTQG